LAFQQELRANSHLQGFTSLPLRKRKMSLKHWHGATPNNALTHIAIQEQLNGKAVEWMEKVTDEQYRK